MVRADSVRLRWGRRSFATAAHKTIQCDSGNEDSTADADGGDLTATDGLVGEGPADAEKRRRLFDREREATWRGGRRRACGMAIRR